MEGIGVLEPMQLREGSFVGSRPACPKDPQQRVYRHGCYERYADCNSQRRLRVERFLCPRCGRTLSVLPKSRLPYIALSTAMVEADFDGRTSGTDPPPSSEKERGDHSRLITFGAYYRAADTAAFHHSLKEAVQRRGIPYKLYTDLGRPFTNKHTPDILIHWNYDEPTS